jgi:uncharacterized protein (TIGR00725 family)
MINATKDNEMTNANGRRTTIGVIGKNEQHANDPVSAATMQLAHEIGRLIAAKGGVVVTGGLGGVMSAASKGAKEAGGLTIGFLPSMDRDSANEFVDVVFPTGLGRARNLLTARGCDSIVMIGGGCGTLNELTIAYADGRPVVILRGSGGWSDKLEPVLYDGQYMDERKTVPIQFGDTPADVVEKAFAAAKSGGLPGQHI